LRLYICPIFILQNIVVTNMIDSLPTGRELTAEDTYPLTATEKSRFFVIIGATGSGKTTLVTAIYHTFLKGNSKERYLFAGSKTLAAFESRSYYVRTASMRTNVEMRRTPRGSIDSILHLRLKECRTGSINNLLFSDFSGEDYSAVSANVVAAKEDFQIVKAARQIVVLLDGEKMITRQSCILFVPLFPKVSAVGLGNKISGMKPPDTEEP